MTPEIRITSSAELLDDIYRFRYSVYVEEMGRPQRYADHRRRLIAEPLDYSGFIYGAFCGNKVVGTVRSTYLRNGGADEYCDLYGIGPPLETSSITTKLMVAKEWRTTTVAIRLALATYERGLRDGIKHDYIDCNSHLLKLFLRLGYIKTAETIHPEYGLVNVMRLSMRDIEHLVKVRSPFAQRCGPFVKELRRQAASASAGPIASVADQTLES